jgi:hypothetical protein
MLGATESDYSHTMLNHSWVGGESSFIKVISRAPMNGKLPKIRLIILYLPVRCIIHL